MDILDDKTAMENLDADGMVQLILHFDEQINRAAKLAAGMNWGSVRRDFTAIAVAGMGGSAIGGDLLVATLAPTAKVPVTVIRDYHCPAWVGRNTLVLASSYSGNTSETLSVVEKSWQAGAQIIAITSGGKLDQLAQEQGWPLITVPAGQPPRASMGFMFVPLWVTVFHLGLCPPPETQIAELVAVLRDCALEWSWEVPTRKNYAKELAHKLFTHPVFVYSLDGPLSAVSYRWRGQIQENGKMLVSSHAFPEFCHNEITGYEKPQPYVKDAFVIVIRDPDELPQLRAQVGTSVEVIKQAVREVVEITGNGSSQLIRALSLIYLGDWVSFYLAMLNGVDPTSIKSIKAIKSAQSKASG